MTQPHISLSEITFWRDEPSMDAMEENEHGDWVRRETVEDLIEQLETSRGALEQIAGDHGHCSAGHVHVARSALASNPAPRQDA